jgi:hypothetical protein
LTALLEMECAVLVDCAYCGKRLCLEAEHDPTELAKQAAGRVTHDDCPEDQ